MMGWFEGFLGWDWGSGERWNVCGLVHGAIVKLRVWAYKATPRLWGLGSVWDGESLEVFWRWEMERWRRGTFGGI